MLSILIPTFNYDCTRLVAALRELAAGLQASDATFDYEIMVWDDASTDSATAQTNCRISGWDKCEFRRLTVNLGRAAIRNRMIEVSHGDYVLLIDSDAEVGNPCFLKNYWHSRHKAEVVCGGITNPAELPGTGRELRYKYEQNAEKKRSVAFRNRHPYLYFTTFNVMLSREVTRRQMFDERCTEYGYEDALYGLLLRQSGVPVCHIDNPLVHLGIETSPVYLKKTEAALQTLSRLGEPLQSVAGASRVAKWLERCKLRHGVALLFARTRAALRKQLTGPNPSLFLFNVYKVGYYALLQENANKCHR